MLELIHHHGLLEFLLEANVAMACFIAFYLLVLRKLTHFAWHRAYILVMLVASLAVAGVSITTVTTVYQAPSPSVPLELESPSEVPLEPEVAADQTKPWWTPLLDIIESPQAVIAAVFWLGSAVFAIRFCALLLVLTVRLSRASQHDSGFYISSAFPSAFAFFQRIYLPASFLQLQEADLKWVIAHEQTHARLGHSFDSLLLELLKPLFWYNPLYWWLQGELKSVHEFQVDASIASNGQEHSYSKLLLKLTSDQRSVGFVHPFSMRSLKQRILKIHQQPSSNMKKARFLLMLPLLGGLFYAFSFQSEERIVVLPSGVSEELSNEVQFVLPIASEQITRFSSYGWRIHPLDRDRQHHDGIDLVAKLGTEVVSIASGKVIKVTPNDSKYGRQVVVEHAQGFVSRYAHLNKTIASVGDSVNAGAVIGLCGTTGVSTGPHLHLEIRKDGELQDPEKYLPEIGKSDSRPMKKESFTVIIDAGHGGQDPGQVVNGRKEKELSLGYAQALREELEQRGFKVAMTRDDDEFLTLKHRAELTGNHKQALFISLHFNASEAASASGMEIFIPGTAHQHAEESEDFASSLNSELAAAELDHRGVKRAEFMVLRDAKCPAALVELGFMTAEEEMQRVLSAQYQEKVVNAIARSVEEYVN